MVSITCPSLSACGQGTGIPFWDDALGYDLGDVPDRWLEHVHDLQRLHMQPFPVSVCRGQGVDAGNACPPRLSTVWLPVLLADMAPALENRHGPWQVRS